MSEYQGYGSEVIMDKVAGCKDIGEQIEIIKKAMLDQDLARKLHGNPRFNKWLSDYKELIVAIYR